MRRSIWIYLLALAPSLLQKLSVSFYLKQLCPVTISPDGLMALFYRGGRTCLAVAGHPRTGLPEHRGPGLCLHAHLADGDQLPGRLESAPPWYSRKMGARSAHR